MGWEMTQSNSNQGQGKMNGIFVNTCRIKGVIDQSKEQNSDWAKDMNIQLEVDLLDKQNDDGSYWTKKCWIKGNHKRDEVNKTVIQPHMNIQDLFANTNTPFKIDDAGGYENSDLLGLIGKECKLLTYNNTSGGKTVWGRIFRNNSTDENIRKKFTEYIDYCKSNGYKTNYQAPSSDPEPAVNADNLDEVFGWDDDDTNKL